MAWHYHLTAHMFQLVHALIGLAIVAAVIWFIIRIHNHVSKDNVYIPVPPVAAPPPPAPSSSNASPKW